MIEFLASDMRMLTQAGLAWTICLAALAWGGGPERAVALTWLIVFEIGLRLLPYFLGLRVEVASVDLWLMTGEVIACAVFVAVALYANRNYTLWIASLQVLATMAHLARGLVETVSLVAYAVMIAVPGWVQLFLLAFGLTRHILRKRKYGQYRDWRKVSPNAARVSGLAPLSGKDDWQKARQPSWRDDLK